MSVSQLFWAESVAVVGASATPGKTGHTILANIIDGGFAGRVYPVNPRGGEILGLPAYPSLGDVPGDVDLVVVVIPAAAVPGVIREAAAKHARAAVVISGGFREAGNDELEKELVQAAGQGGVRVVGPNCQGVNFTPNKLCASWPLITTRGSIAAISQSGTVGAAVAGWAADEGLGISSFVALGNRCDVNEIELMEFFGDDSSTRAIALYVEGVADGRAFVEVGRKVAGRKGLVVLSPGRTAKGARAAQSHTRSLAGSHEVFRGVCRQIRAVEAEDTEQLYDFAKAFALTRRPVGPGLFVITSSGGSGIMGTDAAETSGLSVFDLEPGQRESIRAALPPQCVIGNPLDLTGDADAARYRDAVLAALESGVGKAKGKRTGGASGENTGFLLVFGDPIPGAADVVNEVRDKVDGEVFVSCIGGGEVGREEASRMLRSGVPVYPTPERAVRAMAALRSWWARSG